MYLTVKSDDIDDKFSQKGDVNGASIEISLNDYLCSVRDTGWIFSTQPQEEANIIEPYVVVDWKERVRFIA